MMVASTEISDKNELIKILSNAPRTEEINYTKKVSVKNSYIHKNGAWDDTKLEYKKAKHSLGKKIIAVDFGIKRNILNELCETGLEVEVVSHNFDELELIKRYKLKKLMEYFYPMVRVIL